MQSMSKSKAMHRQLLTDCKRQWIVAISVDKIGAVAGRVQDFGGLQARSFWMPGSFAVQKGGQRSLCNWALLWKQMSRHGIIAELL